MFVKKQRILIIVLAICLALQPTLQAQWDGGRCGDEGYIFGGLAWSWDGEFIAVGTTNGVQLHRSEDLTLLHQLASDACITSLGWRPNGEQLAIGIHGGAAGERGRVELWDTQSQNLIGRFDELTSYPLSVAWSPDGEMLVGNALPNTLIVWDEHGQRISEAMLREGRLPGSSLTWNPTGESYGTILNTPGGGLLTTWNAVDGQIVSEIDWPFPMSQIVWSPSGEYIAASSDEDIVVFDAQAQRDHATFYVFYAGRFSAIRTLTWNPSSTRIAAVVGLGDQTYELKVWDFTTGEIVCVIPDVIMTGDGFYANGLAYSPDGTRLASISDDGRLLVWDAETCNQHAVYDDYRSIAD